MGEVVQEKGVCLLGLKASKKKALMFNTEPCESKGFFGYRQQKQTLDKSRK